MPEITGEYVAHWPDFAATCEASPVLRIKLVRPFAPAPVAAGTARLR